MNNFMTNLELIGTLMPDWLLSNALLCWPVVAVLFMLLEIFFTPAFVFFSLGHIFVAVALYFGIIDNSDYNLMLQCIIFSLSSLTSGLLLALILYRKRQKREQGM